MENSKFQVRLVGIIFDPKERKILLSKEKDSQNHKFIEVNLCPDEELDKELKRVIKEDTGYKVHNLGAIYAENKLENREDMNLYFLCEATEGKENKSEKFEELIWVSPSKTEEMVGRKFPPRLREFILALE